MDIEDTTCPTNFESSSDAARETWQLKNNITTTLNPDSLSGVLGQQEDPWINNPLYFKRVEMSDLTLLKMELDGSAHECTRARDITKLLREGSSRTKEVVGLLKGKIHGDAIIVTDAVALDFEDTETSVGVRSKLLDYFGTVEKGGGFENVVGWYRTSVITDIITASDVETQMRIQELQECSFAVVIDSCSTIDFGRVRIQAFRTYPKSYKPPARIPGKNVPQRHIELVKRHLELTKHLEKQYALSITYFKSSLTTCLFQELWEIYWRRLVSMWSRHNSGSKTKETVDQRVLVDNNENEGGLTKYYVHVKREFTKQYKSTTEAVDELYVKLVEDVGSSKSMIRAPMNTYFFISLTEEQAKKLADHECVELVRREYIYRAPTCNLGTYDPYN